MGAEVESGSPGLLSSAVALAEKGEQNDMRHNAIVGSNGAAPAVSLINAIFHSNTFD
jgi:hypothetical protein